MDNIRRRSRTATIVSNTLINMLFIGVKLRAVLIFSLLILSFIVANYILIQPMNFGTFSQVMPFFVSGLAALLAIVIGFNNYSMQNETNSMASELKRLDEELNRIEDLLRPLEPKAKTVSTKSYSYAARIATEAIYQMVHVASDMAERLIRNSKIVDMDSDLKSICQEFVEESKSRLTLFAQTHSIYSLTTISTTDFIIRLRFWTITAASADDGNDNSEATKEFFETLRRLHVLRNIGSTIFIRHNISNLSYEMLLSTIPVIILTAAVSFAFDYDKYDPTTVRLVYASTFSMATLPFILFTIRTIPIVHLTKSNSGLPFSSK